MQVQRRVLVGSFAAACLAAFCVSAQAKQDLLQPDEAFQISARRVEARVVVVDYIIAPGYQLYSDRFRFRTDNPAVVVAGVDLPPALESFDKATGQNTRYYAGVVSVRVRLSGANQDASLVVTVQGCAVAAGLCYAPITKAFRVPATGGSNHD